MWTGNSAAKNGRAIPQPATDGQFPRQHTLVVHTFPRGQVQRRLPLPRHRLRRAAPIHEGLTDPLVSPQRRQVEGGFTLGCTRGGVATV